MSNNEIITDFSLIRDKQCMICCDSFSSKDSENFNVIRLKCGHLFKYNHLYLFYLNTKNILKQKNH